MNDPSIRPEALPIVIAMLTYLRPDDLVSAIPELVAQARSVDEDVTILVVDNDPEGSAMAMARSLADPIVRFVHEPTPGISAARNRALDEAADKRLLIFIDDDERPQPGWLESLLITWSRSQPAAVVGPVVSTFPEEPDPWIVAGGFFDRRRLPTGSQVREAATNNLLLDMDQIRTLRLHFDQAFGESGGSDSLFTRQLSESGASLVWCDEAVVVDVVPHSRLNKDWVLRKYFRIGNGSVRVDLALAKSSSARLGSRMRGGANGLARMIVGLARQAFGIATRSLEHRARGSRTLASGLGMASASIGFTYFEYGRKSRSR